jgi:cytochrome c oxidase subunit II
MRIAILIAASLCLCACDKPAPKRTGPAPISQTPLTGDPQAGRRIYNSLGCATCHAINGNNPQGPTLSPYWMTLRKLADGREIIADEAYTRRAILDPPADLVPGYPVPMTAFKGLITDAQLNDLIAYIRSLSN